MTDGYATYLLGGYVLGQITYVGLVALKDWISRKQAERRRAAYQAAHPLPIYTLQQALEIMAGIRDVERGSLPSNVRGANVPKEQQN